MSGKILVTGCSGLVGTHTSNKLVEKGYEVIGVDINTSKFLPTKNFEFHQMDLRDADDVSVLFDQFKFDGVINDLVLKVHLLDIDKTDRILRAFNQSKCQHNR